LSLAAEIARHATNLRVPHPSSFEGWDTTNLDIAILSSCPLGIVQAAR
jgi:hypothetical protein